jgi:hypothetical protein
MKPSFSEAECTILNVLLTKKTETFAAEQTYMFLRATARALKSWV